MNETEIIEYLHAIKSPAAAEAVELIDRLQVRVGRAELDADRLATDVEALRAARDRLIGLLDARHVRLPTLAGEPMAWTMGTPVPVPDGAASSELLPCPFCGAMPKVVGSEDSLWWYSVRCPTYACPNGSVQFKYRKQAVAAWNRRAPRATGLAQPPLVPDATAARPAPPDRPGEAAELAYLEAVTAEMRAMASSCGPVEGIDAVIISWPGGSQEFRAVPATSGPPAEQLRRDDCSAGDRGRWDGGRGPTP